VKQLCIAEIAVTSFCRSCGFCMFLQLIFLKRGRT